MIRDVTEDFRWGRIVGEVLLVRLAGPSDDGGEEDRPSAARATWIGSRLGESFDVEGRFCIRLGNGSAEGEDSERLFRVSTVAAS